MGHIRAFGTPIPSTPPTPLISYCDLDDNYGRLLGDHESLKSISANGNFSHIFKATDKHDTKTYAIKRLTDDARSSRDLRAKLSEATILAQLEHPNIIRYYNSWVEPKGGVCMKFEYCGDGDANQFLTKSDKNDRTYSDFIFQVGSALAYLHEMGVAHLDVKLDNILRKDNNFKLCDFGTAKDLSSEFWDILESHGDGRYADTSILNTCSKDQLLRADTFSLGISTYESMRCEPLLSSENETLRQDSPSTFDTLRQKPHSYSDRMINLIRAMMKNSNNRISISDATTVAGSIFDDSF